MYNEIYGKDMLYSFNINGNVLTITFKGISECPIIKCWDRLKPVFKTQLKYLLDVHTEINRIDFQGDAYGEKIFDMCRLDLYGLINKKRNIYYKVLEDTTMKLIYINDFIIGANRYAEPCDNGLVIESETIPLDTHICVLNMSTEESIKIPFVRGRAVIPSGFLEVGKDYVITCLIPEPQSVTNAIELTINNRNGCKYATPTIDYNSLLGFVEKLTISYLEAQKKLSAHVDGYEVI